MEKVTVGRSNIPITRLVLGSVTFGREISEEQAFRIMDHALENNVTTFDTAEQYGGGQSRKRRKQNLGFEDNREFSNEMHSSESIIGRWFQSRGTRKDITLCTKVGTGGDAENVAVELARSLDRLNTDFVDIFYMHTPNRDGTPISETLDALSREVDAGRIVTIGCSNYSINQVKEALACSDNHGYRRFEIVQPPFSLVSREAEKEMFKICNAEGIGVVTYSPLAAGLLTGLVSNDRLLAPKGSRFYVAPDYMNLYFSDRNFRIVEHLRSKSKQIGIPMARLAMAWVLSNSHITAMLIGSDNPEQFDEAIAAYHTEMDPSLIAEMSSWD